MKTHVTFLAEMFNVECFLKLKNMNTRLSFSILMMFLLVSFQGWSQMFSVNPMIVQVHSEGLQVNMFNDAATRNISVYLPPDYSKNPDRHYPVVYLLSMEKETNNEWFRPRGDMNLVEILDKSIHSGRINPVIVVAVDGRNKLQGGWYTNSQVTGNWEDFIVNDVLGYVDQNFRTLPFPSGRGIAGKSMGGYGALKLATKHPDKFNTVYAMNAFIDFQTLFNDTIIWKSSIKTALEAKDFPTTDDFANRLLAMSAAFTPDINAPPIYGQFPLLAPGEPNKTVSEQWLKQDPMQMITSCSANLRQLKALVLDCNITDKSIIFNGNYSKSLTNNGIANTFLYYNGNNEQDVFQRVQDFMLPVFSENLSPSLLQVNSHFYYSTVDQINAWLNTDGKIIIVPFETSNSEEEIEANKLFEIETSANNRVKISLTALRKGVYKAVGIASSGFIGKPYVFGINEGTPRVKIGITDFTTGKPIEYCDVMSNEAVCKQDPDGYFYLEGGGTYNLSINKEKYYTLKSSVMVYTDTVFNFLLVKDSYLKVIEKGYGKPVWEAVVTQNGRATLTGPDGFTTVQNLDEGMLDCRIFKPGYFTEVVHMPLQSGNSATVELTLKQADISFVLVDEKGTGLPDAVINIAGKSLQTDENGRALLENVETRQEYTFTISQGNYETLQETIYLEADITIARQLSSGEKTVVLFSGEGTKSVNHLVTGVENKLHKDLRIYPNPANEVLYVKTSITSGYKVMLSDLSGRIVYQAQPNETVHSINLSSFNRGIYLISLSSDGYSTIQKIVKQ